MFKFEFESECRVERLVVAGRHSHVGINSRTERSETSTTKGSSLGASLGTENTTSDTSSSNTVGKIVLGAETLNATLSTRVERTDDAEVLRRRPRARAHILETTTDLLAPGEVGDSAALGCEGRIVGHLRRNR